MLHQREYFTLQFDWSFPCLDWWVTKSLDCMPGSTDECPFCNVASATPPYPPSHARSVVQALTVATAFRWRGCFFLRRPSPEYDSPQSHFRFGTPLLENRCRHQSEAFSMRAYEASRSLVLPPRDCCVPAN